MAKSSQELFEVTCPCCSATLKVDPDTQSVISHVAAVKPKTFADFETAAKAMREQEGRKESIFRQAVDAEKNKAEVAGQEIQRCHEESQRVARRGPSASRL